ncbi:hypothetical protein FALCPG4_008655 [Fusarium falciforme]
MSDKFEYLHERLDGFHDAIATLTDTSTQEELKKFTKYLSPVGEFYLGGMNVPPIKTRDQAVGGMKELLNFWRLKERKVRARAVTPDGKTAIAEMESVLEILGERLDFKEIEVADFDDEGLIVGFRIYCDNKPVEDILARHAKSQ